MTVRWQQILSQGFGDAKALLTYLGLPISLANEKASYHFPTRVPRGFADRMVYGDADDPLLRQVLVVEEENHNLAGYVDDPLREKEMNPVPGLIHKYHGRLLITVTGACAINCRYCFRRHFPYHQNIPSKKKTKAVWDYIKKENSIHEVILSGGDPLLASDDVLSDLFDKLESISHVKTIRIHSRIPIVLPERLTDNLLTRVYQSRCKVVLVVHCNHPNELVHELKPIFERIRQEGIHLLNQSVLLRRVNDDAQTLVALSHKLFSYGVLPYYLHTLDKVAGAAHFDVDASVESTIYRCVQESLPGYLVPKLVTERPGAKCKIILGGYRQALEKIY